MPARIVKASRTAMANQVSVTGIATVFLSRVRQQMTVALALPLRDRPSRPFLRSV
jgi:hypothetical protein